MCQKITVYFSMNYYLSFTNMREKVFNTFFTLQPSVLSPVERNFTDSFLNTKQACIYVWMLCVCMEIYSEAVCQRCHPSAPLPAYGEYWRENLHLFSLSQSDCTVHPLFRFDMLSVVI